jgi:hypothetical protein
MMASFNALECRVGAGTLLVATDAIEALGEYQVGASLPATDRLTFSLGDWQQQLVMSVSTIAVQSASNRNTAGLLLLTPGAKIRWALEITAPMGMLEVVSVTKGPATTAAPWMRTATLVDGRTTQLVDIKELLGAVRA